MRVLQLINRVPWPLTDGGAIGYYNAIKGYHDAGCEVTVFALNTHKHFVAKIPKALTELASWHTVSIDNRVKTIPAFLNLWSSASYHVERFISQAAEAEIRTLLQQQTFDVVVFESLFMMPYESVVSGNSSALRVLRQYNVEHVIWQKLADSEQHRFKKWYLKLLAKRLLDYECSVLNKTDVLNVLSEDDASQLRQMGCTKPIHISPLGITIPDREYQPNPVPHSIFHLGSMDWQPNLEAMEWFVTQVWPCIEKEHPNAVFYMAGKHMPPLLSHYQRERLKVVGAVSDAVSFMASKQIMVVPLFSGSGIRVKILEGMALGKAIVATGLGAQGIACEHGKNILIANTADEFCQCIGQLLNNPLLCETLGTEARKLVIEKYSNTKVTADVLTFYRQQSTNKGD